MIVVESPNNAKLFYNFNLEKKVRKNHPLRKLKEILNLDFMYGLLKEFHGRCLYFCINQSFLYCSTAANKVVLNILFFRNS